MKRGRRALVGIAIACVPASASCFLGTDFGALSSGNGVDAGAVIDTGGSDGVVNGSDATDGMLPPPAWRLVTETGPGPRHSMRIAFDEARGNVWMMGGWKSPSVTATTEIWAWNGTAWSGPTNPTGPSGRHGAGMAYDSKRQEVVYFGGPGSPQPADTWIWNGTSWALRGTPTAPNLYQTTMAYDADRGTTVVFGGHVPSADDSAETWEWNGSAWSKLTLDKSPEARRGHVMSYDSDRKKVVLVGGHTGSSYYGDTWEFDGTWTPRPSATILSPRFGACMAYHAARHVTVIFGGKAQDGSARDDTWLWDGNDWKPGPSASGGPKGRFACAMAYDAVRRAIVMYGGSTKFVATAEREMSAETWVLE